MSKWSIGALLVILSPPLACAGLLWLSMSQPEQPPVTLGQIKWSTADLHQASTGTLIVYHEGGMELHGRHGKLLVAVDADGAITYGGDYTPDDVARAFWDAIATVRPCPPAAVPSKRKSK